MPCLKDGVKKTSDSRQEASEGANRSLYESGLEAPMVELQCFPTRVRSDGLGSIAGVRTLSTSIGQARELALPDLEQRARQGLTRQVDARRRLAVQLDPALLDQAARL